MRVGGLKRRVAETIEQFTCSVVNDLLDEIELELEHQNPLTLTDIQKSEFLTRLHEARHRVLERHGIDLSSKRQ